MRKMRQGCVKNDTDVVDLALASGGGRNLLPTSAYGCRISLCFLIRCMRCERVATIAQTERTSLTSKAALFPVTAPENFRENLEVPQLMQKM